MDNNLKFVEYDKYCNKCINYKENENDPEKDCKCDECLAVPALPNSHKPLNFKEK